MKLFQSQVRSSLAWLVKGRWPFPVPPMKTDAAGPSFDRDPEPTIFGMIWVARVSIDLTSMKTESQSILKTYVRLRKDSICGYNAHL